MNTVHAYAATEANGSLEPFEYELGPIGPEDVDINVESCGICHSDLSMLEDAWGMTQFPFVPGHEVIGTASAVGEHGLFSPMVFARSDHQCCLSRLSIWSLSGSGDNRTAPENQVNPIGVDQDTDVFQRVTVDHDEVCELSCLHSAD